MIKREQIEWRDIWVTGATAASLPRLLLVGDSITRGYFDPVEKQLTGQFLCARLTTSTCVCDPVFAKELALLIDDYRFAVIHFNNGLHGWDYAETAYAQGLGRAFDFITERSPHSRLIWASSTPVRQGNDLQLLDPKTDRVRERNRLAHALASQRKLPINDLFGCVIDHPEYFAGDGVHFNPTGQMILGNQVVQTVQSEGQRAD